jgi:hypothetical protein
MSFSIYGGITQAPQVRSDGKLDSVTETFSTAVAHRISFVVKRSNAGVFYASDILLDAEHSPGEVSRAIYSCKPSLEMVRTSTPIPSGTASSEASKVDLQQRTDSMKFGDPIGPNGCPAKTFEVILDGLSASKVRNGDVTFQIFKEETQQQMAVPLKRKLEDSELSSPIRFNVTAVGKYRVVVRSQSQGKDLQGVGSVVALGGSCPQSLTTSQLVVSFR